MLSNTDKTPAEGFSFSFRDKQRLHDLNQNQSRFFFQSSLSRAQSDVLFTALKRNIDDCASEKNLKTEFQYQLMMSSPDPNTFLNLLAGWRDSVVKDKAEEEKYGKLLDEYIRIFDLLYPEIYDEINAQKPIPKPA